MRRLLTIATMTLICTVAYSQSTQRQAFQEVRVDTMRPNHYGPVWGIVFAWHDSVGVRIFRDSMNVKNISGDTAVFKYYKNAFTYDTTNHNARFAADTIYRAAQESAIRAIIAADTLYRAAQESAIRSIIQADTLYRKAQQAADSSWKNLQLALKVNAADTNSVFYSFARTRDSLAALRAAIGPGGSFTYDTTTHNAVFAADTLYRAAQEALMVKKTDSTIAAGYATRTMLQADTLYRSAQLALKWAKSDTASSPGIPTINRMLDSLDDVQSRISALKPATAVYADSAVKVDWAKVANKPYTFKNISASDSTWWWNKRDTASTPGIPTINRMLDSLNKVIKQRDSSGTTATYITWPRLRDSLAAEYARSLKKVDSGSVYMSWPAGRDSLANARARYVWKPDSGVVYSSWPQTRDSLAAHRGKFVAKPDSGITYASWAQLRDSLAAAYARNVRRIDSALVYASYPQFRDSVAKLIKVRDSTGTTATYMTWPRARDSLAAIRASMNGLGGGGALVSVLTSTFSTTSGTYVDVTGTSVAVAANSTYSFTMQLHVELDATGGGFQFSYPSGATIQAVYTRSVNGVWQTSVTDQTFTFTDNGVASTYMMTGQLKTSSTAGALVCRLKSVGGQPAYAYASTGFQLVKQ